MSPISMFMFWACLAFLVLDGVTAGSPNSQSRKKYSVLRKVNGRKNKQPSNQQMNQVEQAHYTPAPLYAPNHFLEPDTPPATKSRKDKKRDKKKKKHSKDYGNVSKEEAKRLKKEEKRLRKRLEKEQRRNAAAPLMAGVENTDSHYMNPNGNSRMNSFVTPGQSAFQTAVNRFSNGRRNAVRSRTAQPLASENYDDVGSYPHSATHSVNMRNHPVSYLARGHSGSHPGALTDARYIHPNDRPLDLPTRGNGISPYSAMPLAAVPLAAAPAAYLHGKRSSDSYANPHGNAPHGYDPGYGASPYPESNAVYNDPQMGALNSETQEEEVGDAYNEGFEEGQEEEVQEDDGEQVENYDEEETIEEPSDDVEVEEEMVEDDY